jgi:cell division septum initiation protein DivIVA
MAPSAPGPTIGDASAAAARLLEIASTNADQLMEQAKEEADRIVGEARSKAERITNEARGKADRYETDARIRAQKLDDETNERRQAAVATIERERYELQREVEHLRAYEREYRARLKNYFQSQLDQLAANDNSPAEAQAPAAEPAAPRRARVMDDQQL